LWQKLLESNNNTVKIIVVGGWYSFHLTPQVHLEGGRRNDEFARILHMRLLAKKLAGKSVSKLTHFVSNGSSTLDPINQSTRAEVLRKMAKLRWRVVVTLCAVVCMIMTMPSTWSTKARAVLNTWARRCHIPLFFYSWLAAPPGHPIVNAPHTVPLDVPEGRGHLTGKTMAALRYSLRTYGNVADWFLKCDDDT